MRITTAFTGVDRPFERDRVLVLRCLPVGATLRRAVATITPHSRDPDGQFTEPIAFDGSDGDWGARLRPEPEIEGTGVDWVEVDLHARRRLASVSGTQLENAHVLVDLGGGFMAVGANGGIGGDGTFELDGDNAALPGLTVAGVRFVHDSSRPTVTLLKVASPPSNVTLAPLGGPTMFTHVGELVDPVTSPDLAGVLQGVLADAPVEHGHHVVELVVHSDTIARLDVALEFDVLVTPSATPADVDRVVLEYAHGSVPTSGEPALVVPVPPGGLAVPGATSGRLQGAFEETHVVAGPTGRVTAGAHVELPPGGSLASPIVLDEAGVVTSVDLLLTSVTAAAEVAVDIVADLDGKPARDPLLSAPAVRRLTRDAAPDATWLNVKLPGELELPADDRHWLVVQAREGAVTWGAAQPASTQAPATPGRPTEPTLQHTRDGGLSWRTTDAGAVEGLLRLRHTSAGFRMPLELRVDAGGGVVAVDLQRFAAAGSVDLSLDLPELADAINAALGAAGATGPPRGEHVANGGFDGWIRAGDEPVDAGVMGPAGVVVAAFTGDGTTVVLVGAGESGVRVHSLHTYCRDELFDVPLDGGNPTAVAVDPAGTHAVVATTTFGVEAFAATSHGRAALAVVDLRTGRQVGTSVPVGGRPVIDLVPTADGAGLLVIGPSGDAPGVQQVQWHELADAARRGRAPVPWAARELDARPIAAAAGQGGRLHVVTDDDVGFVQSFGPGLTDVGHGTPTPLSLADPRDVAVADGRVIALSGDELMLLEPGSLRRTATLALPGGGGVEGHRVVADPAGPGALVLTSSGLLRLDVSRRRLATTAVTVPDAPLRLVVSPVGNRGVVTSQADAPTLLHIGSDVPADWELTAGTVAVGCLGDSARPTALLGAGGPGGTVTGGALSQVLPVAAGTAYRLLFDALATEPDASVEVLWRAADGAALRVDRLAVATVPGPGAVGATQLVGHELVRTAPQRAVAAELRVHAPSGAVAITDVAMSGTSDLVTNPSLAPVAGVVAGWTATSGVFGSSTTTGTRVNNGAPGVGTLAQVVSVTGRTFELAATIRPLDDVGGAAVRLAFRGDLEEPLGEVVVPIEPLAFDHAVATGEVPANAAVAELALVLPSGAAVEVEHLSATFRDPVAVTVDAVADAPGRLVVSDASVGLDEAPPTTPGVPAGGLPPATPPGSDPSDTRDHCHCAGCGAVTRRPESVPTVTPEGRPAALATCRSCGAPQVVLGGSSPPAVVAVPPTGFTVGRALPATHGAAVVARTVDVALTVIDGIGDIRVEQLAELGIRSVARLAVSDPERIATIRGVSEGMARRFVGDARRLAVDAGHWVLAPPGVPRPTGSSGAS